MKWPTPLDVLVDLRAYFRNSWVRQASTAISLDNKRFVVRFGPEGQACHDVLERLGFQFKPGESWVVPQPSATDSLPLRQAHNVFLDNVEVELDVLIANGPDEEEAGLQDTTAPEPAMRQLSRVLGCQNYEQIPSSRTTQTHPLHRARPFTVLGIPENASDDLIIWAYRRQSMFEDEDPQQIAVLMTALEDIQRQRQSEKLTAQVAIERSVGRYGQQTIADAYRSLGLSPSANDGDSIILGTFQSRLFDAPAQEQEMRDALAIIGDYRKSQVLVDFARNMITTYEDALRYLDVDTNTDDSFVTSMFTTKINDNASTRDMAEKALRFIADHRNSDALRSFIAAGFQGDVQQGSMDIGEAFSLLGVEDRTLEDDTLFTVYNFRMEDDTANHGRLRQAIETIAKEKDSAFLKSKLGMPSADQSSPSKVLLSEPVGLSNIGNTCYLNSLLQALFTISAVRDIVLNFDDFKDDLQNVKTKRVGNRKVDVKEIRDSQSFVVSLAELFRQMISSPTSAVQPTQELATLTLERSHASKEEKEARRRSTLQSQRRPTLGMIDDRPVFGPVPQINLDADISQPLQSPEAMDISAEGPLLELKPSAAEDSNLELETHPRQTEIDTDNASDSTLISQDGSPKSSATTEGDKLTNGDTTELAVENVPLASAEKQVVINESLQPQATHPASTQDITKPQELVASSQEGNIEHSNQNIPKYKPPEGPPPIPPRPQPKKNVPESEPQKATLEWYARQQDVSEVLSHAIVQLSCAIRPQGTTPRGDQRDGIHDTFYGEEQKHKLHGGGTIQAPLPFQYQMIPIYNQPKDLYAAMDNSFDPEQLGSTEFYTTINSLPPILCQHLGRVIGVYENGKPIQQKLDYHVDIPSTLYMDRYLDVPEGDTLLERRQQAWQYKKELRACKARIDKLEPTDRAPVDVALNTAVTVMQHLAEVNALEKMSDLTVDASTITKMTDLAQRVREERTDLKQRITILEKQIKDSFTDAAFRKHEYKLHAAFFHRGTPLGGHYWVYIYDHVNEIWRKYNDSYVTQVTNLNEIFGNPQDDPNNPNHSTSGSPANPYFLVWARSDRISLKQGEQSIVETVKRDPVTPPPSQPPTTTTWNEIDGAITSGLPPLEDINNDENIAIRPLGTDTPQSSHHEFTGQQSQISYMPPDSIRSQEQQQQQQNFANIGSVMQQGPGPSRPVHESHDSWEEQQLNMAIQQSMQQSGEEMKGQNEAGWDNSENPNISRDVW
ncbi:ubiquitin-specific protease ubp2 [Lithohypha guttulata]|uniref:ubiquitinyl hydrolase 1 n=1 Tax=Lithohypha guttulata TaxID=1690604 RepID=A0AAN7T228_9EURO|nr:ubiquitin-specific protease ubp2 [Lithohypha guttulata]